MTDLAALKQANAKRWQSAKLTRKTQSDNIALHLFRAKARYQAVEAKTGVPWAVIAVIHERESSQDWKTHLGQGDPLDRKTVHVPAGRGPFATWEEGAYDALVLCPPFLARHNDWSLSAALTALETYNGVKYAGANRPSPYVWSGTSIYDPPTGPGGKVLVDHGPIEEVYPSGPRKGQRVVDPQLGCAALLMSLIALDPSITFTGAKIAPAAPVPPVKPSVTNPSPGSIGAFIASIFNAIFGRKTK